jgi:hypothetical protein
MKHLSQRVLANLRRHLQEGSPTNKGWGKLSAGHLKALNLKLKIQEETDRGSSPNLLNTFTPPLAYIIHQISTFRPLGISAYCQGVNIFKN